MTDWIGFILGACRPPPSASPTPSTRRPPAWWPPGSSLQAALTLATGWLWLVPAIALGFLARVLAGPRFSLLGRLATQVVAPRLGAPKLVPGPPKRFAQGIGLTLTTVASVLGLALGWTGAALALVGVLAVFALLESVVGFCAGCWVFGHLMRLGVIPHEVCVACNDLTCGPARPSGRRLSVGATRGRRRPRPRGTRSAHLDAAGPS